MINAEKQHQKLIINVIFFSLLLRKGKQIDDQSSQAAIWWMDGWIDGWMDVWMDGWMDEEKLSVTFGNILKIYFRAFYGVILIFD